MTQIGMKRLGLRFFFTMALSSLALSSAWGFPDSVAVESMTVQGGTAGVRLGIFLSNADSISYIILPLVIRSASGTASITGLALKAPSGSRLTGKLDAVALLNGYFFEDPEGCIKGTTKWAGLNPISFTGDTLSHAVAALPAGCLFVRGMIAPDHSKLLPPGTDGAIPLFAIGMDIGSGTGTLEIDTSCANPSNHVVYSVGIASPPPKVVPAFTKGVITVIPSAVQYLGGDGIPRDYSLDQNYPNPFNASTVIKFNTKHDGNVRLEVFNILGQKVATLVNEFRHFGPQAADWDGTDVNGASVPTGLYFYRLVTSDYTDVKKMVLLK